MLLQVDEVPSPVGTLLLATSEAAVCALDFADCRDRMLALLGARFDAVELQPARDPLGVTTRLRAYLEGDLEALRDVPVDTGGTPFQRSVWQALRDIPAGTTQSYGELARRLGRPSAARAVGAANGRNPVALVLPCHRVIGHDGALTGYAGGIDRKRWLLEHEARARPGARGPGYVRRPMASTTTSGRSAMTRWPASGMVTSSAPAISRAKTSP